jgi:hypothetical protein
VTAFADRPGSLLGVPVRRKPVRSKGVDILGDNKLLDFWLERVAVG